jgi:hypothetical protein
MASRVVGPLVSPTDYSRSATLAPTTPVARRDQRLVEETREPLDETHPGRSGIQPCPQQPVALDVGAGVALGDRHIEIGLHLFDESDRLTSEFAPGARQRAQMCGDEVGPCPVQVRRDLSKQLIGPTCQLGGMGNRLVFDDAA